MKKRLASVLLALYILMQGILIFPASASYEQMLTEEQDIFRKISYFYQESLDYANKTSFDGYCAYYVNCQLYLLKINRQYVAGNGNDEFDNYRYKKKSNGGYDIAAYPASKYSLTGALEEISQDGTKDVYNVLVGFQKGLSAAGRKYGHTCFIHAILDGVVYYSDSMEVTIGDKTYPEGTPIACSIEEFGAVYEKWTLDGLIHFTYEEHTCDARDMIFAETDHPHQGFYQCTVCGQVWKDENLSQYVDVCYTCNYPEKPVLQALENWYLMDEEITFSWEETELTTGYVLILESMGHGSEYTAFDAVNTEFPGLTLALPENAYRAKVRAINENGHVTGSTEPAYMDSEWVYFGVTAQWDCQVHGHILTIQEVEEPTCTEDGFMIQVCARCDETPYTVLPALGHRYNTGTVTVEPTLDAVGELVCDCVACGDERTEFLPSLGDNPFEDLFFTDYYYVGAVWAYGAGITIGVTETEFMPKQTASRAQVVTFLWRAARCPQPETQPENWPFVDVDWESYYGNAVLWALEQGITKGMSDTKFRPNDPVTRGQFVTFLYRMAGEPETDCGAVFVDVVPGAFYEPAVLWATRNSITNGVSSTKFCPNDSCTRGQVVTFLYRYYNWLT